ncbi:probable carbohydrate esterase At4g34215 [Populus nigra]|uniref:probable carbohydrate esterase At4g34215 n=1 Tax=Populus nigra TaxID=3691 RepID=UPI002B26F549|nr:probable carbohydrate esterase At4g34215 [Populus nigra]
MQTLWYQGESDTSHIHDAEVYQRNMERLIEDVREDLGLPSLPIIMVAIISGDGKYVEKVREARPGINLPNVVCVDAKGLHLKEDRLQLTAESQVKLGHILADAYLKDSASSLLKIKGIDCLVFDVSGFCTVLYC